MNSRPEANASASIPRERTSRFMARQTDSSSSTIAISGLDLLKGNVLRAPGRLVKKFHMLRCAQSLRLHESSLEASIVQSLTARASQTFFSILLRDQSRGVRGICILDLSPIGEGDTCSTALRWYSDLFHDAHPFGDRIHLHLLYHRRAASF